ncbi:kinase-like domain-containing protein [Sphaerosporella brunnea]|uniref:non-specific serine/threonine protein kinase n=1 Tax=Sphaerosporella brunnea TaxID=1250544 RepID=A0A5J5F358_9PEZI|nr:kinase-like domain-containing protein [Sphaerosporella brunnea]
MRSRSTTPNHCQNYNTLTTATNQPPPPQPPNLQHPDDLYHSHLRSQTSPLSNMTSANTSRQTSSASIHSMPFSSVSRHSTPPTPMSSPGLFRPPSNQLLTPTPDGSSGHHYLHPSQYRQTDPVRETHQLETDYDPMTGRKTVNEYSIIEEIGRGTHGKVKLGYDMRTRDLVAIKVVERSQGRPRLGRKGDGGESSETKIRREIAILKKIQHENVVRLLEVIDDDRSKKVYLVLEYVVRGEVVWRKPGDPDDDCYVPAMNIEDARKCFRDTVVGLDHLHYNGVVHRDIKPANLLWTGNKVTKISDFGVSFLGRPMRSNDDDGTGEDEPTGYEQHELELAKTAGTPAFFAPELCSMDAAAAKVPITSAIDVWALGVTLFGFIFGRLPFMADSEFKLFKCIAEEELVIPRQPVDDELRDLIKRLLTKNPSKRITLKEVKRHPWVLRGIQDPVTWVERTDPDVASHGNKIQVTSAEVETAVSVPSVVYKLRKVASSWVKGLRKGGSSAANNIKDKGKQTEASSGKQGQKSFFTSPKEDDLDKELQWMGGIQEPRVEEEKLNPIATNSSTASSETVQAGTTGDQEWHDQQWASGVTNTGSSPDKKLRRKQSMNLLGANLLRRHSVTHDPARAVRLTHRRPHEPPPVSPADDTPHNIFKAESTAALAAPTISRIMRSVRSDDNGRGRFGRKQSMYENSGPPSAREVLSDALYSRNTASDNDTLPTVTPQPRSLYKPIEGIESGTLNIFPRSPDASMKQKMERQRREEQEQARLRLGKLNLDDMLDQPCPPSPDDEAPPEQLLGQENQRMMMEEKERRKYTSSNHTAYNGSLPFRAPEGWSRESFYHPSRDWPTPPIAMASSSRSRGGYFEPPSPKGHHPGLVTSSSDERFVTTAGSSLTNSTSFPSINTDFSSVSSDVFLNHWSRKSSFVPTEYTDELDDEERLRIIQEHTARGRKQSETLFAHEEDIEDDDSGSDSEGGFVMKDRRPRRSHSVMVGDLARQPVEVKDAAIKRGRRPRIHSRSSGGTVTSTSRAQLDQSDA